MSDIACYTLCMKNKSTISNFGKRLAMFRKAKGLTQAELAKKIKVSRRVIAYYEAESNYPPTHFLIPLAKTLKISVDELLGLKKAQISDSNHAALWRKLKKVERLPPKDQKTLISLLNAMLPKKT